jgi:hypothetical protein
LITLRFPTGLLKNMPGCTQQSFHPKKGIWTLKNVISSQ